MGRGWESPLGIQCGETYFLLTGFSSHSSMMQLLLFWLTGTIGFVWTAGEAMALGLKVGNTML